MIPKILIAGIYGGFLATALGEQHAYSSAVVVWSSFDDGGATESYVKSMREGNYPNERRQLVDHVLQTRPAESFLGIFITETLSANELAYPVNSLGECGQDESFVQTISRERGVKANIPFSQVDGSSKFLNELDELVMIRLGSEAMVVDVPSVDCLRSDDCSGAFYSVLPPKGVTVFNLGETYDSNTDQSMTLINKALEKRYVGSFSGILTGNSGVRYVLDHHARNLQTDDSSNSTSSEVIRVQPALAFGMVLVLVLILFIGVFLCFFSCMQTPQRFTQKHAPKGKEN